MTYNWFYTAHAMDTVHFDVPLLILDINIVFFVREKHLSSFRGLDLLYYIQQLKLTQAHWKCVLGVTCFITYFITLPSLSGNTCPYPRLIKTPFVLLLHFAASNVHFNRKLQKFIHIGKFFFEFYWNLGISNTCLGSLQVTTIFTLN